MLSVKNFSFKHSNSSIYALKNISLLLSEGESILVTGKSGSGKSTLLSAICGLIPHYYKGFMEGEVTVSGFSPSVLELVDTGKYVAVMLQNPELQFFAPTVYEEIYLTLKCRGVSDRRCFFLADKQLKKFGIEHIKNSLLTNLSEGQKQKVILAGITALKPRLILLDEPTANLDPKSIDELKETLIMLKNEGISFVIADHRLSWLEDVCEKCAVMEFGEIAWLGDMKDLGSVYSQYGLRKPTKVEKLDFQEYEGDDAVIIKNLSFSYKNTEVLKDLNLRIPFGKVTTLSGPSGSGKTTLARVLSGLEKKYSGEVFFRDKLMGSKELKNDATVILQNCDHQLYMKTVLEEMLIALDICRKNYPMDSLKAVLEQFGLMGLEHRHPQSLSGGEKQRLVVAAGALKQPKLLILDEPTSGLDGYNLKLMSDFIRSLRLSGSAVLVITHDVELINMCSDYQIKF